MKSFIYAFVVVIGSLAVMPAHTAPGDDASALAGEWEGTLEFGATSMPIALQFRHEEDGKWTGQIIYHQFGGQAVPLKNLKVDQPSISFEVFAQPPFRFEGRVRGERLEGPLFMGDVEGRLVVSREPS